MIKLIDNLLIQQIWAGKSSKRRNGMPKFVKQIEINLIICPKKSNRSKMTKAKLTSSVPLNTLQNSQSGH